MKWIWGASEFVRKFRLQMRFGELSRAPLRFLRLELREQTAECEWLARASDPWDTDLPFTLREQNETFQALRDAITLREFLFASLPEIHCAVFKVYRQAGQELPELIISGTVTREDEPPARISSLVMRAKLCGLRFALEEGAFQGLDSQERDLEFATQ